MYCKIHNLYMIPKKKIQFTLTYTCLIMNNNINIYICKYIQTNTSIHTCTNTTRYKNI